MQYTMTSVREVIGQVVRNTRLTDTSYIADIGEWIPEAMGKMQTKYVLSLKHKDIKIAFNKACIPSGLRILLAAEYRGMRLRYDSSSYLPHNVCPEGEGYLWFSLPYENDYNPLPDDLTPVEKNGKFIPWSQLSFNDTGTYYVEPGVITTPGITDGTVRLHYMAYPVDEKGYPMIPDNENYKSALYWYCRAMMIGSGYPDKVFSYKECFAYWDELAPRAVNEIDYPSPDRMSEIVSSSTGLVIPDYSNFE